jgi:hypothetical protein
MLRLELKPDRLTEMAAVYATGEGLTVEYDAAQSALMVSSALALLRPNEYKLVMALLVQRKRWQESPGTVPFCLSIGQLCAVVNSASDESVCKQLNRAALKVAALGICIYPLHGENSYFVLFAPEVGKQRYGQTDESLPFKVVP